MDEKEKQMFGSYLDAEIAYREQRIRSDWAPTRRRRARGHHRDTTSQ